MSTDQNKASTKVFIGVDSPQTRNREAVPMWFVGKDDQKPPTTTAPHVAVPPEDKPADLSTLVSVMQSVQTNTPEAELNKTTIDDGNGGRITMNDELTRLQSIKGVEDPSRLPNKKR